jgi:uncharacterized phage protein gp47/JayE
LKQKTGVTDIDPGQIARTFCEVISEKFQDFYTSLDLSLTMVYVSTATGQFLDLLGAMLQCIRLENESDANYRARITNQVYVIQGANFTAIRLKCLSIAGVKDIIAAEYTYGTGSFTVYVVTDDPETPQSIINEVEEAVADTKALGIFAEIRGPEIVPLDLKLRLIFNDKITETERATIRQSVKQSVKRGIDNLGLGGSFSRNGIIQTALSTSTKIVDVDIASLKISGVSQYAGTFLVAYDQRMVLETLEVV